MRCFFFVSYTNDFFENNLYKILDGEYIISLKRNIKSKNNIYKGSVIEFDPYISISTKNYELLPVYEFIDLSYWLLNLHDFLTQTRGKCEYFEFYSEDEINRSRSEKLENGDFVYYRPNYEGRFIMPQLVYFETELEMGALRLANIKDDYGNILGKWFKNKERLTYIIDLYKQNKIPGLDIETILVNKIKMLETYFDNFINDQPENNGRDDQELEEVKNEIKDYLENSETTIDVKEEIIRRLDSDKKHRVILREKLTAIFEKMPEELIEKVIKLNPKWVESSEILLKFAERLKDTRNFHTHGADESKNKKRLKTTKEYILADSILDIVIYYSVLFVLEISDEDILSYPFIDKKINEIKYNL